MQKLINGPDDSSRRCSTASSRRIRTNSGAARIPAHRPGRRAVAGKVAIATGGGSGHLPVFLGLCRSGLADGAAVGNVFASPSADQMLAVIREIDGGAGVLLLYGNYGGDVMNFGLAAELAAARRYRGGRRCVATDDVASAPKVEESRRRGIAGIFFLYKVAGASADRGSTSTRCEP